MWAPRPTKSSISFDYYLNESVLIPFLVPSQHLQKAAPDLKKTPDLPSGSCCYIHLTQCNSISTESRDSSFRLATCLFSSMSAMHASPKAIAPAEMGRKVTYSRSALKGNPKLDLFEV